MIPTWMIEEIERRRRERERRDRPQLPIERPMCPEYEPPPRPAGREPIVMEF